MKNFTDDTRRALFSPIIQPIPLIVISYLADEGERTLRLSDREYEHEGHLYLGLISRGGISDISTSLKGIGGIAFQSTASLELINVTGDPAISLSTSLEDYILLNQDVTIDLICDPIEEAIRVFSGKIQDVSIRVDSISLSIRNTTFNQLYSVPADLADLNEYPNIPLAKVQSPIPVVFGNLNTPPAAGREAKDVKLAPCMNLDFLTGKYTAATRANRYGNAYLWTGEGYYLPITKKQNGENFTAKVPNLSGFQSEIPTANVPLGPGTQLVRDPSTDGYILPRRRGRNSYSSLSPLQDMNRLGDLLSITLSLSIGYTSENSPSGPFGGERAIALRVRWAGNTIADRYQVSSFQENSGREIDPSETDRFSVTLQADQGMGWNFSSLSLDFDIGEDFGGARQAVVKCYVHSAQASYSLPFSPSSISENIYQSVEGYRDLASNYADGGVVKAANAVLSSPLDIAHALLRDEKIGMGFLDAQVDRTTIVKDRAKMPAGYRFDFSMNEPHGFYEFSNMLSQGLLRMSLGAIGKWKIAPYSVSDPVIGHFSKWNIDSDTLRIRKSPIQEIYSHFFLRYGWNDALGFYTKSLIRSYHAKRWGKGTISGVSGANATLRGGVPGNVLQSDAPINVGDRIWFDGNYYTVRVAVEQTAAALDISVKKEDGDAVAKENKPYFLGANFDYRCWQTEQRYGLRKSREENEALPTESKYIAEVSTAEAFLDAQIEYYGRAENIVTLKTDLAALALDPGDMISIDHPLLGDSGAARGSLDEAISWTDTAFAITQPAGENLVAEDVLILEDTLTGGHELIRVISASAARVTACERGYGHSIQRRWGVNQKFKRVEKKYQITDLVLNLRDASVTITSRSVRS